MCDDDGVRRRMSMIESKTSDIRVRRIRKVMRYEALGRLPRSPLIGGQRFLLKLLRIS